jgi:16S rRNA (cytosine967-C5)-methyltransferase
LAKQKPTARSVAASIIKQILLQKASLTSLFAEDLPQLPENERGLCQQLCYGVLRWQPQLQALSEQLLKKPFKNKDLDIAALILCGLYQLRAMRVPEHAAISETVNASKTLGKSWASGLINATLRNYQRQQQQLNAITEESDTAKYAHPEWLVNRFKHNWPEQWQSALNANNQQAPMMLRVNKQHYSRDEYLALLAESNIQASEIKACSQGVILNQACDVYELPGFVDGAVSVQDGAAQLVAELLQLQAGQHILDACAAPGGKTGHILELAGDSQVTALDIDEQRLQQIEQNLDRLKLSAKLIAVDASKPTEWWDQQKFDRILIDAPCSGTGVIRRHPDIKQLRRERDIRNLAIQQRELLEQLWPLLKPDGLLVYTTCSALKEENEYQIRDFLQQHAEAEEFIPENAPATRRPFGYQRLPGDDQLDGFYYACIQHR